MDMYPLLLGSQNKTKQLLLRDTNYPELCGLGSSRAVNNAALPSSSASSAEQMEQGDFLPCRAALCTIEY